MREIFRNFSDIQVSKQVKHRKTAIHKSVYHQFIIHPWRVRTSGPLTIMTFSVIELFGRYWGHYLLCFMTFIYHKLSAIFAEFSRKVPLFFRKNSAGNFPTCTPSWHTPLLQHAWTLLPVVI